MKDERGCQEYLMVKLVAIRAVIYHDCILVSKSCI
jgi:hypothetical protein